MSQRVVILQGVGKSHDTVIFYVGVFEVQMSQRVVILQALGQEDSSIIAKFASVELEGRQNAIPKQRSTKCLGSSILHVASNSKVCQRFALLQSSANAFD